MPNIASSGRRGTISTKKVKNNMLAAVLVLTVVPSWVKVGRAVIEHCCFLISQKLSDSDEVTITQLYAQVMLSHVDVPGLFDGSSLYQNPDTSFDLG